MVLESVGRVVGGTYQFDVVSAHEAACRETGLLQFLVALVVDGACRLGFQYLVDAEGGAQFEVGPVVEWVAHAVWHRLSPFLELLPVAGIAGDVVLVDAVAAQCTPLVVVAAEPQFGYALEPVVVCHHLGVKVAVVVNDWHLGGVLVIKPLCRLGIQQEVFVKEGFHTFRVTGLYLGTRILSMHHPRM